VVDRDAAERIPALHDVPGALAGLSDWLRQGSRGPGQEHDHEYAGQHSGHGPTQPVMQQGSGRHVVSFRVRQRTRGRERPGLCRPGAGTIREA